MASVAIFCVVAKDDYNDRMIYDISSQAQCVELYRRPSYDCRWQVGLHINIDQLVLGGDVVAYKILWSKRHWSDWYVTGVNDIDWKYNAHSHKCSFGHKDKSLRRVWSYFYGYYHKIIFCKNPSDHHESEV